MRRALIILITVTTLIALQAAPAAAASSPYTFSDPVGDAPHGRNTNIVKVVVTHSTTVKIAVFVEHSVAFSRWGTNGKLDNIQIHFAPNDPYISGSRDAVALLNGESVVPGCPVTRIHDATRNRYVFKVARSCVGNPGAISIFVFAGAHGATSISESDRAPASGFTPNVNFG